MSETNAAAEHLGASLSVGLFALHGANVLLIDDDPSWRVLATAILRRSGASVTTASSVKEAIERLQEGTPHAILTDIGMPDEDGYCLLRRLRELETIGFPRIPCAALTAYPSDEHADRALAAGFDLFLTKPVNRELLVEAMAALVAQGLGREIH
jgi:CheY-like chemotaxis protein